jgi:hypothetical protein
VKYLQEASKKNHKLANMGESIHLEEGLDDIDLPDTFIIARRMQMRKQPLLCVSFLNYRRSKNKFI